MSLLQIVVELCLLSIVLFVLHTEWAMSWLVVSDQFVNHISMTSNSSSESSSEIHPMGVREEPISQFLSGFGDQERNQYDYEDIVYPIPFNILYHNRSTHYLSFDKPIPPLDAFVRTGPLPPSTTGSSDVLFITGASENHAICSFNCLYSMMLADPYASFLYVDFGLSNLQIRLLASHLDTLHQIQKRMRSKGFLAFRRLNWRSFPKWMDIRNEKDHGGYSWKMVVLQDAFLEWKGVVSWMDGGNLITDGLSRELTAVRQEGIYSPCSSGTIGKWVHPGMQQFLLEHQFVKRIDPGRGMGMGGVLFVDYSKPVARRLMTMLSECIYTQKCVSPKGSSRQNHRQDQAILSVLLHEFRIRRSANSLFNYHPSLRNEVRNDADRARPILNNLMLLIQRSYHVQFNNSYYPTSGLHYSALKFGYPSRTLDEV